MMNSSSKKNGLFIAGLSCLLLGVVFVWFELAVSPAEALPYLENGHLSDAQEQSLKVMLDLNKLIISWAIAVIGATGFFLKLNLEKGLTLRPIDLILTMVIICIAVISLFMGHLAIDKTAEMLSLDQFPVTSEFVRNIGRIQYLSGLSAVTLFGFHVFQFFWTRLE